MFAVRKLLETPNYGCKAVNLGELAALVQAWAQPHPSLARLTWCSTLCCMLGVLGCVSCGACQHSMSLCCCIHAWQPARGSPTQPAVLGALVSFCAGTGKGTSVLEMVTTFEAATGVCSCL